MAHKSDSSESCFRAGGLIKIYPWLVRALRLVWSWKKVALETEKDYFAYWKCVFFSHGRGSSTRGYNPMGYSIAPPAPGIGGKDPKCGCGSSLVQNAPCYCWQRPLFGDSEWALGVMLMFNGNSPHLLWFPFPSRPLIPLFQKTLELYIIIFPLIICPPRFSGWNEVDPIPVSSRMTTLFSGFSPSIDHSHMSDKTFKSWFRISSYVS